jgi:hypothetical protein
MIFVCVFLSIFSEEGYFYRVSDSHSPYEEDVEYARFDRDAELMHFNYRALSSTSPASG